MRKNILPCLLVLGSSFCASSIAAQQPLPEAPSSMLLHISASQAEGNLSLKTAGQVEFLADSDDLSRTQNQSDNTGLKKEEKQRILGIVPARNIVLSGEAPPLTKAQKFGLFTKGSIDPFAFFVAGVVAGIEQSRNTYPGWGQDAGGFGQRYGAVYADNVDSRLWGAAVLPSLFHQDPRYFRKGQGPKMHRRGTALLLDRGLVVTAEGAVGYIVSEFYPDVLAHFHHDTHRKM